MSKLNPEQISAMMKRYQLGDSQASILEEHKVTAPTLCYHLRKNGVRLRKTVCSRISRDEYNISFSDISPKLQQILIGSLLGDGSLRKHSETTVCFTEEHCEAQHSYLYWKYRHFKHLCSREPSEREYKGRSYWGFSTSATMLFREMRKSWYKQIADVEKKIVCYDDLVKLDPLGLAVWYMDDGSASKNPSYLHLYTSGFTINEQHILVSYLKEKWHLHFRVASKKVKNKKYYYLVTYGNSMRSFIEIVRPHIVDCMKYKLSVASSPRQFSNNQIREIRAKYETEMTQRQLAEIFGVSYQSIQSIVHRKSYKDVE